MIHPFITGEKVEAVTVARHKGIGKFVFGKKLQLKSPFHHTGRPAEIGFRELHALIQRIVNSDLGKLITLGTQYKSGLFAQKKEHRQPIFFKKIIMKYTFSFFILLLLLVSCETATDTSAIDSPSTKTISDPLPSWNDGASKTAIIKFVKAATTEGSPGFIPVRDRVATFDNDGTLWSEKPAYFQLFFAIDKVNEMAADHPEWKDKEPFKSVLEKDMKKLASFGEHEILEIFMATHAGNTVAEFEQIVKDWLATARHPRFDRPFTDLVYQPMLELLEYLRANDFKTFIVSGGGIEFMRPWVEDVYGIPRDQVVGSSIKTEFTMTEGKAEIKRLPAIDFIDDKAGKPVGIHKFIGIKPVMAAGNSDGDLQMLQWTDSNTYPSLQLYVHHTDADREWAYDKESSVGRLEKGLEEAAAKGWTVASMKEDWKVVYPFEVETK